MVVQGDRVLVVGRFDYAGNKTSRGIAIWHTRPELTLNYPDGGPGSAFAITGRYLRANSPVTVQVNRLELLSPTQSLESSAGSGLVSDANGEIRFNLVTSPQASPASYQVTLSAGGSSGSALYQLANGLPVRPPQVGLPSLPVPVFKTYLPVIQR